MGMVQKIEIVMENKAYDVISRILQKYCFIPSSIEKINNYYIVKFNKFQWSNEKAIDKITDVLDSFKYLNNGYGYKFLYTDIEENIEIIKMNTNGNKLFNEYIITNGEIIEPSISTTNITFKPLEEYSSLECQIKNAVYNYMKGLHINLFKLDLCALKTEIKGAVAITYNVIPSEEYTRILGKEIPLTDYFKNGLEFEILCSVDTNVDINILQHGDMLWITAKEK
jgi:hypothetical protein